jgi:hypothetical protein
LDDVAVERLGPGHGRLAVEEYECDGRGIVSVRLRDLSTGHEREFTLSGVLGR